MTVYLPPTPARGGSPDELLSALRTAVLELQTPQRPTRLWAVATSALPPAADWTGCAVFVSDAGQAAVSDGSTWVLL